MDETREQLYQRYTRGDTFDLADLRDILSILRDRKTGCPWDSVQTYESLIPCTLEEAYEVADAVYGRLEPEGFAHLREELGDLLFSVLFHAQLAQEEGRFTFEDVIDAASRKMIHRHPQLFGDRGAKSWEALKEEEHGKRTDTEEMNRIPAALPALVRASKVQKIQALRQPDRPISELSDNIRELLTRLETSASARESEELIGEALYALAAVGRGKDVNCEIALTKHLKNIMQNQKKP